MTDLYYVCLPDMMFGISRFTDDDSMPGIMVSKDVSEWVKFDYEEALKVKLYTGYEIVRI